MGSDAAHCFGFSEARSRLFCCLPFSGTRKATTIRFISLPVWTFIQRPLKVHNLLRIYALEKMEVAMKKALLTLLIAGAAVAGVATSASAQSVYFGFGSGGGWNHHRHYDGDNYRYYRPRPYYRPYASYGYSGCYFRTYQHFNRHRGHWVVRRVRVCD